MCRTHAPVSSRRSGKSDSVAPVASDPTGWKGSSGGTAVVEPPPNLNTPATPKLPAPPRKTTPADPRREVSVAKSGSTSPAPLEKKQAPPAGKADTASVKPATIPVPTVEKSVPIANNVPVISDAPEVTDKALPPPASVSIPAKVLNDAASMPKPSKQQLANVAIVDMLKTLSAAVASDQSVTFQQFEKIFPNLAGKVIGQTPSIQGLANTVQGFANRVVQNIKLRLKDDIENGHCPDPDFLNSLSAAYAAKFAPAKPAPAAASASAPRPAQVQSSSAPQQSSPSIADYLAKVTNAAAETRSAAVACWAWDNNRSGGKPELERLLQIIVPNTAVPSGIMQGMEMVKLRTKICSVLAYVLPKTQISGRPVRTPIWVQSIK